MLLCPGGIVQIRDTGKVSQGRYELSGTELKVRFGQKTEIYKFKSDPQLLGVRDQLLRYNGPPDCSNLTNEGDARPGKSEVKRL